LWFWFGGAAWDDVFGPWAFFSLDDVEADRVTFLEIFKTPPVMLE
jgi:hypothetical protein